MAWRLVPDCIQLLFTHTYVCVTFLILFGTMWALNMNFDVSFFAVVASLLGYLELSVMDFGICIRNLVNYFTAVKRIEVDPVSHHILESSIHLTVPRLFFYSMNPKEINGFYRVRTKNASKMTKSMRGTPLQRLAKSLGLIAS